MTLVRLVALVLVWAAIPARAQLGLEPIDRQKLAAIPEWTPEPQGVGESPSVDLREDLPAVGNQAPQNSCTAWAVAYACRSHVDARDTGRRPTTADRVFSPAFVYNQINRGVDRGSQITDALELLVRVGCATWATMPYDPRDFTRPPPAPALAEAARHRCRSAHQLKTGAAIRRALQQRNVVILAIRTDPVFLSGMFRVFGPDERARGNASAASAPLMAHGYHALCAVGYDDRLRAFRLMNSWGPEWGQGGYCWVSYDLMDEAAPDTDHFVQAAFVLVGPRSAGPPPVPAPAPVPARRGTVSAVGNAWYLGVREGRPVFGFRLRLAGADDAVDDVADVAWHLGWGGREQTHVVARADTDFELTGSVDDTGVLQARGDVRFRDGSTQAVEHTLRFAAQAPADRSVQLVQTDRYWGRVDGRPQWRWTLHLEGSPTDLADVARVVYHLHPSFPDPDRIVTGTVDNGFAFTTTGWGVFPVRATVCYVDGSTQALGLDLVFKDPVRDELRVINTSRPVGRGSDDRMYYDWTVRLDGPQGLLEQVRAVRYVLHPTFVQPVVDVVALGEHGFPLSSRGWGEFDLKAEITFGNGATQTLVHHLSLRGS